MDEAKNKLQLLTLSEVSSRLKVSRTTIRKRMSLGEIVPVRIGRSVRFTEEEVARWIRDLELTARDARDGQEKR